MTYIVRVQLTEETDDGTSRVFADFEEDDPPDTIGRIYREARAEYGRCQSKVFNETKDGTVTHVGWFFVKRVDYVGRSYNDLTPKSYLQGAWVTVYREVAPERPRQIDYADLGGGR
jgi:hypothetical protein